MSYEPRASSESAQRIAISALAKDQGPGTKDEDLLAKSDSQQRTGNRELTTEN